MASRKKGLKYIGLNRVLSVTLDPDSPPNAPAFDSEVDGFSDIHEPGWFYSPLDGWDHDCTCEQHGDCGHAYAAAMAALGAQSATSTYTPPTPRAVQPAAFSEPDEEEKLISLLGQRLGRRITSEEMRYVRALYVCFRQSGNRSTVPLYPLVDLGLASYGNLGLGFGAAPAFEGWWTPANAPASLLEFWQYLAHYAERNGHDIPAFMRPITDTSAVRDRIDAFERKRDVERWKSLFAEARTGPLEPYAHTVVTRLPRHIRLRLTLPKLTWDCREEADSPWQEVKSAVAGKWFDALDSGVVETHPESLALLQQVAIHHASKRYYSGAHAHTLKIEEERTVALIRLLLASPTLRKAFVAADGIPFEPEPLPLRWLGRPLPDRPEDIVFELVRPDGSPLPEPQLRLTGNPVAILAGHTLHLVPPGLPGHQSRATVVPREALQTSAALRALHRISATVEGVDLPQLEIVTLLPRLVCDLVAERPDTLADPADWVRLELHGVSPDGALVQRLDDRDRWTTQQGTTKPSAPGATREIEHRRAAAALPLIHEFGFDRGFDGPHWWRTTGTRGFAEQFATWAERCRSLGVELLCCPELAGLARPADRARVDVSVKTEDEGSGIDWFDLEIAVRAEDSTLTDAELKLLLKAKGRFVRLPGKGWRRLSLELSPEETAKLAELGLEASALEGGSEKQRFHALQLADERIAGLLPEQHAARARERAAQLTAIAAPAVPANLTAELRPYQKEGFHFLAHLAANGLGGVLADDMGLGKTVQALTWLLHLAAQRPSQGKKATPLRALVVCPKSVVPNWTIETKKFAPSLTAAPLRGAEVPAEANLVVINYAQLRRAAKELGAVKWDAVILDEGQNIKNPQSQTARAARDLRAAHRIVLTGTPIENRTLDLWSLFAFAMPGLLGSQASFKRAFNDKSDPGAARSRLARRVKHFMLRRTKGQVAADLPPRTEEDLFVDLDGAQRRLYDAELKRTRAMLLGVQTARDFDQQRFNILQSLLRLRQICCDPRLIGFENAKAGRPRAAKPVAQPEKIDDSGDDAKTGDSGSAKLEALLDTLEPLVEEGHRVLVFSQFVTMLELIADELAVRGIRHLMLTGQTENRQDLVNRFQSAEGEPVFLLSLKAAGAGLNLTAASYVVLFDPWWNPAVEAQAIDRTHRIGQTEHVLAYRLLARNTIEEKIRKLQQAKADLARSIVQEETLSTVMSLDDLRFILSEDRVE